MLRTFTLLILILLFAITTPATAGELSDFRESATRDEERTPYNSNSRDNDSSDATFWAAVVEILSIGAGESVDRLYGDDNGNKRQPGEALLPFLRLDLSRQDTDDDIEADDIRFEIGWGPVAFHLAKLSYTEDSADDQLEMVSSILMLRTSVGSAVEIDFGLGLLDIENDPEDMRPLVTIPILIHPNENFGIELRPAWTDKINDMDAALLLGGNHMSLKLGYRLVATDESSLHGPYIGLSLRY